MSHPVYITVGSEYPQSKIVRSAILFPIIKDKKRFSLQCIEDLKKSGIVFEENHIVVFIFEYTLTKYILCWIMKNKGKDIAHSYVVNKTELHELVGKSAMDLYRIVENNEAENAKVISYLEKKIVYFIGDVSDPKAHTIADTCIGRYKALHNSNKGYKKSDTDNSFRRNINSGVLGNDPYVPPEFHAPMGNQQGIPNAQQVNTSRVLPELHAPMGYQEQYDNDDYNDYNDDNDDNLGQQLLDGRIHLVGAPGPMGGRSKRTKRTKHTKRTKRTKRIKRIKRTKRHTKRR